MKKKELATNIVCKSNENLKHIRLDRRTFVKLAGLGVGALAFSGLSSRLASASQQVGQTPINPALIPKYVHPLPVFGPASITPLNPLGIPRVSAAGAINVSMEAYSQQILPLFDINGSPLAKTNVWVYKVGGITNYPAVTLVSSQTSIVG